MIFKDVLRWWMAILLKKTKSETLMQILFLYGKGLRSDEFDVDPAAR